MTRYVDFGPWVIALLALVALVWHGLAPWNKRRAPRPRVGGAPDRRAHQPPLERPAALAGRPSTPHASGV